MDPQEIAEEEVIEAIREAFSAAEDEHVPGAYTSYELSQMLGKSQRWVQRRLRALKGSGKVKVILLRRKRLDGEVRKVPAYIFTEGENVDAQKI